MISKENFKNNLTRTLYFKLKETVGETYTNTKLGNLPITYLAVYPQEFQGFQDKLPLIILEEDGRGTSEIQELGGRTRYRDGYDLHIIAGGYKNENHNSFLKNALSDEIYFSFDRKVFDYKNYDTNTNGTVQGTIKTYVELAGILRADMVSTFSKHRIRLRLSVETLIYNN